MSIRRMIRASVIALAGIGLLGLGACKKKPKKEAGGAGEMGGDTGGMDQTPGMDPMAMMGAMNAMGPAGKPVRREYWTATLTQGVLPVKFGLTFTKSAAGHWSGTLDLPANNVKGLHLTDVKRSPKGFSAVAAKAGQPKIAWVRLSATLAPGGKKASGFWRQGRGGFPVTFTRVDTAAALPQPWRRPQTPKPPFPYVVKQVKYAIAADKCEIAAVLTTPQGKGPFPAVVLVSGSGQQNADSAIMGHKPFAVIADHLARAGFATLRYHDRSVPPTTCKVKDIPAEASDTLAAVAFLKKHKEIAKKKIGILGHSVGGIVVGLAASRSPDVAFVITIAGAGFGGHELIPMQMRIMFEHNKVPADVAKAALARQVAVTTAVMKNAPQKKLIELLYQGMLQAKQSGRVPELKKLTDAQLQIAARVEVQKLAQGWSISYVKAQPAKAWAKVKVPILVIGAGKDTQVPAQPNVAAIANAAKKGGNTKVTTKIFPNLNHLFQPAKTGMLDEYADSAVTFDKSVLAYLVKWLKRLG